MKELFKQYNEEFIKKQLLVGGEVFFTTYEIYDENKAYIDLIFINKNHRSVSEIDKIIDVIEASLTNKGVEHFSISLVFNIPYFAELLNELLNKGYKNSFANEQGLILVKG